MSFIDGVLYVDNSALRSMAACSTQALTRYGLGYATLEEAATLRSGTAAHAALAAHFKGEGSDAALMALADSYHDWATEHVADSDRLAWSNVNAIMEHWIQTHPLPQMPFRVPSDGHVEVGFAYPLTDDGSIVMCGRLDGLVEYQGALYVLEHKTTGRISQDWLASFYLDSQLSAYIWAAQQHTGQLVVGAFLNAIEFSRLPSSEKKCAKHAVSYAECGHLHANAEMVIVTRTPAKLVEWRKTATMYARRYGELLRRYPDIEHIEKVRMGGTHTGACRFCAFREWCRMDRPLDYVANNMVHMPWRPWEGIVASREASTAHKP